MVLILIQNKNTSEKMEKSASMLAKALGKSYSEENLDAIINQLTNYCEQNEVSFLFIQLTENKLSKIQKILNACRELRIPYLIFKDNFDELRMEKILLPVNFLEEEVEKAQFTSAFGRFCHSEIHILQAKDYGTKAATNVARMNEFFKTFELSVKIEMAQKDSFKVEKEAVNKALTLQAGLILITASREYGLDDILFGPKEQHLIHKSTVPLLIINPRGDLYALCD